MLRAVIDRVFRRPAPPVRLERIVDADLGPNPPPLDLLPFSYRVPDANGRAWVVECELVDPTHTLLQAKQAAWDGPNPDPSVAFVIVNYTYRQEGQARSHGYVRIKARFTAPTADPIAQDRRQTRRAAVYQIMWDLGQVMIDLGYQSVLVPRAEVITGTGKFDCNVMAMSDRPMTTRKCNHD